MTVEFDELEEGARYYNKRKEHEVEHSYIVDIIEERDDGDYDATFDAQSTGPIDAEWWGNPEDWERVDED